MKKEYNCFTCKNKQCESNGIDGFYTLDCPYEMFQDEQSQEYEQYQEWEDEFEDEEEN